MNRYFLILLIFHVLGTSYAQSVSFFRVGSLGTFPGGGYVASLATSFNSTEACIKLNTGVSLFGGSLGQYEFVVACKPQSLEEVLEFTLFPNPVVNYTRLVAKGISASVSKVNLIIIDAVGRVVWKELFQATLLRTGFVLRLSALSAGNYFLQVNAGGFTKIIPFVKVH